MLRLRCVAGFLLLACLPLRGQSGWTSLWNGKDFDGWTTWMQQPAAALDVPGLKRDADGKYLEPIGSGRDPLGVFTIVNDVDGRPAIRISGQVFGELRTKRSFEDYHLRFQFKWGETKWPPRDRPAGRGGGDFLSRRRVPADRRDPAGVRGEVEQRRAQPPQP